MTDLPVCVKGIQTWEDAKLCMEHGVHPWLSNHGGRQLEGAPSAAETLVSIRKHCPEVFDKCEVIVDGGVLRGTDILKALCLGAKGVGLGRGFLYSLVFGEPGVNKAIRILKHELEVGMALLGVTSIDQLNPSYVSRAHLRLGAEADECSYRSTREDSPLHRHFHEHTCNSKEVPEPGLLFKEPSGMAAKQLAMEKYTAMCSYHIDRRGHRLVPYVPYNMASHSLQRISWKTNVSSPSVPFHEICDLSFIIAFPTEGPEGVAPALQINSSKATCRRKISRISPTSHGVARSTTTTSSLGGMDVLTIPP
jgi:hypothetical protein